MKKLEQYSVSQNISPPSIINSIVHYTSYVFKITHASGRYLVCSARKKRKIKLFPLMLQASRYSKPDGEDDKQVLWYS